MQAFADDIDGRDPGVYFGRAPSDPVSEPSEPSSSPPPPPPASANTIPPNPNGTAFSSSHSSFSSSSSAPAPEIPFVETESRVDPAERSQVTQPSGLGAQILFGTVRGILSLAWVIHSLFRLFRATKPTNKGQGRGRGR
jgi:hypothetical protein